MLRFQEALRNRAMVMPFSERKDLKVRLLYDSTKKEHRRDQLARVLSYGHGDIDAANSPHEDDEYKHESSSFTECITDSSDPLDVPPYAAASGFPEDSKRLNDAAGSL